MQQRLGRRFMRSIYAAQIDAQRSAVGRKFLDVEYLEPVTAGEPIDCHERKIREVLMIDRVELVFIDQALDMRELECDHPVRGKQVRHACREVVKIGNLRQHIVADDEIGLMPLGDKALREIQTEKLDQRRNIPSRAPPLQRSQPARCQ